MCIMGITPSPLLDSHAWEPVTAYEAYMCTLVARHIDKVGGLDNYILNVPKQKQQSDLAQQLRQRIEAALQKPLRDALEGQLRGDALTFC